MKRPAIWPRSGLALLAVSKLGPAALRLCCLALGRADWRGGLKLSTSSAAKLLRVDKRTAERAFRELVAAGVLVEAAAGGGKLRPDLWQVAPASAWRIGTED